MKAEDKILFHCTRQNFREEHRSAVIDVARHHPIDWEYVYNIAEKHCVAPLIYINLIQHTPQDELKVSHEIVQKFKLYTYRNTLIKEKYATKLEEVLRYFNQNSIPVMFVKGSVLDVLVYEAPWYTFSKDIDLLIGRKKDQIPESMLVEILQIFSGWNIEYEYYGHHDLDMDGMLPIDYDEIWRDGFKIQFRGQDAWVMPPEDLLMSVCINSCRKRFFRLKSLCDIAETIGKYPDIKWDTVIGKSKRYDCGNIVYTALLATKMTVGCDLPAGVLEALGVNRFRRFMIRQAIQFALGSTKLETYVSAIRYELFGRPMSVTLLLPYVTYPWKLIWRKVGILYRTRSAKLRAWREI